jgi:hypothetical protein
MRARTLSAVLEGLIRFVAMAASACVLLGFVLFALDESSTASQKSQDAIAGRKASQTTDPSPEQERARERAHSAPREAVDDINDVLLAPFTWIEPESADRWLRRGVPTLVALIVYGFGLGFLARYAHGRP